MRIGGLTPLTTIDYPGELAAVVFCQGCPWRCRYCHNTHLLAPEGDDGGIAWEEVLAFLGRRRGLLDGVVFSGGEPTLQRGLYDAVVQVRRLGFKVGLHTAGCYPRRLRQLLPLLDWVGLDIKALPEDYPAITGVAGSGERAFESLALLRASGEPHELRVTVHQALLDGERLAALIERLHVPDGAPVVLQACRTERMLDPSLGANDTAGLEAPVEGAVWRGNPSVEGAL